MHIGKLVFSQVIDSLPMHAFRRGVARYDDNRYKKTFSCLDQYLRMTFAQLTHRESLRVRSRMIIYRGGAIRCC